MKTQVADALDHVPGGSGLGNYFGVTSSEPLQSATEARQSDVLIAQAASGIDLSQWVKNTVALTNASPADIEALRALRGAGRR